MRSPRHAVLGRGGSSAPWIRRHGQLLVVSDPPGTDHAPWIAAGATWCLTGLGSRAGVTDVERAIDDGRD
jgi:hypothetical protein